MSFIPRIFINDELSINKEIKIIDKTFHYIVNVIKCRINDKIILINGKDGEFLSEIVFINKKYLNLKIIEKTKDFSKQEFLGLIFSPIQKIDLLLKSATELGTTNFFPIITDFTNKSNIKISKIDGNIIEAIEQSERLDLPEVNKIDTLKNTLDIISRENSIIFFCEERTGKNTPMDIYKNTNTNNKKIYALIGPEGGFSDSEKKLIKSYNNAISITLGNTILRAETAATSILSILKALYYHKQ